MLEELRTLVLFAEEGSIQNVARRLPLTQPAVTRQIQRLEEMLATTLLDRRQKPPRLTPAGLEVLTRGRDILASVEALKSFACDAEPRGVLRLGLVHGLSDRDVAAAIANAVAPFAKVALRLKTGWSADSSISSSVGNSMRPSCCARMALKTTTVSIGTERLGIVAVAGWPDAGSASAVLGLEPGSLAMRANGCLLSSAG